MRFALGLGLVILLSGCATSMTNHYTQTVQSWRGGSAKTLVQQWGKPDRTISNNGRTLFIYQSQSYRNLNATNSPSIGVNVSRDGRATMTTTPSSNVAWNRGAMSISCVTGFEIDKNGKILDTQIQGAGCYGDAVFARRMTNPAANVMN